MESNCISDGLRETRGIWTNKTIAKSIDAAHLGFLLSFIKAYPHKAIVVRLNRAQKREVLDRVFLICYTVTK